MHEDGESHWRQLQEDKKGRQILERGRESDMKEGGMAKITMR